MTRGRALAAIAVLAAIGFLLLIALLYWNVEPVAPNAPSASRRPPGAPPAAGGDRPSASTASAGERSTLANALNAPTADIRADLRVVAEVIDAFRTNFPRDGNPVGSNAEITALLTGRNQLRLALIPPDHPAINGAGELCDRWGTPFFFHAESATKMEIRSAGPDRRMWNDDDVTFTP